MMRERGRRNFELYADIACDHSLRMGGEQKTHDPQSRLSAHGGKHVGELSDIEGFDFYISIIVEL